MFVIKLGYWNIWRYLYNLIFNCFWFCLLFVKGIEVLVCLLYVFYNNRVFEVELVINIYFGFFSECGIGRCF